MSWRSLIVTVLRMRRVVSSLGRFLYISLTLITSYSVQTIALPLYNCDRLCRCLTCRASATRGFRSVAARDRNAEKPRQATTGHPIALAACYVAAWPLPRLDSHPLAVGSFAGHTSEWLASLLALPLSDPRNRSIADCSHHRIQRELHSIHSDIFV